MANSPKLGTTQQNRSNNETQSKIAIITPSAPEKPKLFPITSKHHIPSYFVNICCHILIWETLTCFCVALFQEIYLPVNTQENMYLEWFDGFFAIFFLVSQNNFGINSSYDRVPWMRKVWNNCWEHVLQEGSWGISLHVKKRPTDETNSTQLHQKTKYLTGRPILPESW